MIECLAIRQAWPAATLVYVILIIAGHKGIMLGGKSNKFPAGNITQPFQFGYSGFGLAGVIDKIEWFFRQVALQGGFLSGGQNTFVQTAASTHGID